MTEKSQEAKASFTQASDEKAVYEIGFHVVSTVTEADATAAMGRIEAMLKKAQAEIIAQEAPKRMPFAYRIERSVAGKREKYTEGYFGWIRFEAPIETIKGMEEVLRNDSEILRFMLIHTTRETPAAAPRVFSSDRLQGETIQKPVSTEQPAAGPVSEEELEKSIEALVS